MATAREEMAPAKGKRKKRKKKDAERWFLEGSLSGQGGTVHGAHNCGVLSPVPSLAPCGTSCQCRGAGAARWAPCAGDGSHPLWINAPPCLVLTDGVVFLFLFSLIYLFYTSFSVEERGSHVSVLLIPTASTRSFKEPWPVAALTHVAAAGSYVCDCVSSPVLGSVLLHAPRTHEATATTGSTALS